MEPSSNNSVKAILFDLDNTLIDTSGASKIAIEKVNHFLKSKFGNEDHIIEVSERFKTKLCQESFDPLKMNIDDLRTAHWDEAIQEIKGTEPNRTLASECYRLWKTTRLQHLAIPEPVKSMLAELRKTYKLLLLTNGDTQTQREKISAVGCQELFDAVIVGGEHAEEKPAVSIFQHCCEVLGVKPESCMMVGDSLDTDIQGGINAGFKATVWISKTAVTAEATRPHYTVPAVLDVTTILNNMN